MEGFDFLKNINLVLLESIVLIIALVFLMTIIVFVSKLKLYQSKNVKLNSELKKIKELNRLLNIDISDIVLKNKNASGVLKSKIKEIENLHVNIDLLKAQLKSSNEYIAKIKDDNKKYILLKDNISKEIKDRDQTIAMLSADAEKFSKRNEFWVSQMSELRIKHTALEKKILYYDKRLREAKKVKN